MELAQGDILGGKYRVERMLGRGGMGVVFAATHLELDELVAIKIMHGDAQSAVGHARFQREARAAVRLKSQHVARVLDVDRLPDGGRYMVLEYLEGQDLHSLLRQRGRLPVAEAASYILQACEGLAEAHALGMVHRDIKLQNLFLTQRADGRPLVKILDFGMVKVARGASGEAEASLTDPSTIIGSLRYMAPEQLRTNATVDARADVWSLGVSLYYLISGVLPFAEEHLGALYAAIGGRPATRLDDVDSAIPSEVADVVERALEKNVTRRFQDVRELAEALEPFGADAATVVGIAWRISHVLRPRSPVSKAPPAVAELESEEPTEPTPAIPIPGRVVEHTVPLERRPDPSAPPPASAASEPSEPSTSAEPAARSGWRSGFALMAAVAVVVGFIGTSRVLQRGSPTVAPTPAAQQAVLTAPTVPSAPAAPIASAPGTAAPVASSEPIAAAPPIAPIASTTSRVARTPGPGARLQGAAGNAKDKAAATAAAGLTTPATTTAPAGTTATAATTAPATTTPPGGTTKKVRDRPPSYDQY